MILANGTKGHYPDALTANYLAGDKNAPVLLTNKDTTPDVVSEYLKSSGVMNVTWSVTPTRSAPSRSVT